MHGGRRLAALRRAVGSESADEILYYQAAASSQPRPDAAVGSALAARPSLLVPPWLGSGCGPGVQAAGPRLCFRVCGSDGLQGRADTPCGPGEGQGRREGQATLGPGRGLAGQGRMDARPKGRGLAGTGLPWG